MVTLKVALVKQGATIHPMIESWVVRLLITVATIVAMEPLVALTHRHVMHGFGWTWHRDHHEPGHKTWERNDLFALVGAALSITVFAVAGTIGHWLFWVAVGMTIYGILYALLHDVLVHRRYSLGWTPKDGYLARLVEAHHLHHAVRGKEGGVSFGFLYAKPVERLRAELKADVEHRRAAPGRMPSDRDGALAARPDP